MGAVFPSSWGDLDSRKSSLTDARGARGPGFLADAFPIPQAAVRTRHRTARSRGHHPQGPGRPGCTVCRDELLDGEIFYTLREAQIVIESWRRHYNAVA